MERGSLADSFTSMGPRAWPQFRMKFTNISVLSMRNALVLGVQISLSLSFVFVLPARALAQLTLPALPTLSEILPDSGEILPANPSILNQGQVLQLDESTLVGGAGYQPGIYYNVPLASNPDRYVSDPVETLYGTLYGGRLLDENIFNTASATVIVNQNGEVESVTLTSFGRGYQEASAYQEATIFTVNPQSLGGTGAGFSVSAEDVSDYILPDTEAQLEFLRQCNKDALNGITPDENCPNTVSF